MPTPQDFIPMNPRDYLVLFSLTAGERHGYGIVKDVEEQSGGSVKMDPSNLYRALKRLIQQGLVAESEPRPDGGSERRRYYTLTVLGGDVVGMEAHRLSQLAEAARARRIISRSGRPA